MTARQWLDRAADALSARGCPDAKIEAKWMLADALGVSPGVLGLYGDAPLPRREQDAAQRWLDQRLTGRPLQYVMGRAWFMGHEFVVDERVLIPRQDTELLCERAIERAGQSSASVLDLCTGSGALGISIKLHCPNAQVWLSDLSEDALAVARANAGRLGADVAFLRGDLLQNVKGMAFDLIVCNPPYLTQEDMACLQEEVGFEPALALYGGADGLDFYRRLAAEAGPCVKPGGYLLVEVGAGQAPAVEKLLGGGCQVYRDLPGVQRVVEKQY